MIVLSFVYYKIAKTLVIFEKTVLYVTGIDTYREPGQQSMAQKFKISVKNIKSIYSKISRFHHKIPWNDHNSNFMHEIKQKPGKYIYIFSFSSDALFNGLTKNDRLTLETLSL